MSRHCPDCATEYRDDFLRCADCSAPLRPGPPPPAEPAPEYEVAPLVEVLRTDDLFRAETAASMLRGEGIEAIARRPVPTGAPFTGAEVLWLANGHATVSVAEPFAEEARGILAAMLPYEAPRPAPIEPREAAAQARRRVVAWVTLVPLTGSVLWFAWDVIRALSR